MKTIFMKSLVALLAIFPAALSQSALAQMGTVTGPSTATVGVPYNVTTSLSNGSSVTNVNETTCNDGTAPTGFTCIYDRQTETNRLEVLTYVNGTLFNASAFYTGGALNPGTPQNGTPGTTTRNWASNLPFANLQERWYQRTRVVKQTCRNTIGTSITVCQPEDINESRALKHTVTFNGNSNIALSAANASAGDLFNNGTPDVIAISVVNGGTTDSPATLGFNYTLPNGWTVNSPPSGTEFSCTASSCSLTNSLAAGATQVINLPIDLINIDQYKNQLPVNSRIVSLSSTNTNANVGSNTVYANGTSEACSTTNATCTGFISNPQTTTTTSTHVVNYTPGTFSFNPLMRYPDLRALANPTNTPRGASGSRVYALDNEGTGTTNGSISFTVLTTGVTNTSLSATGWTCNPGAGNFSCSIPGPFNPGANLPNVTLNFTVPQGTATIDTTGTITGAGDGNPSNNSTGPDNTSTVNDLSIAITGPASFTAGVSGTYNVTVSNAGPSNTSTPITVTLPLPAGVSRSGSTGFGIESDNGSTATYTDSSTLNAGSSRTYTISLTPSSSTSDPLSVTMTVNNANDPTNLNNTASVSTTVIKPDLALSASVPAVTPLSGTSSSTFTISNVGTYAFAGTNTLNGSSTNANLSITSASSSSGAYSCSNTASSFSCVNTSGLPVSGSATITVVMGGQGVGSGGLSAALTADNDVNTGNNNASGSTTVTRQNDLSIAVSANNPTCTVGTGCVYTVTVLNAGPSASAAPISLSLALPTGVTAGNGSNFSNNTPSLNAGTATWTDTGASIPSGSSKVYTISLTASSGTPNTMVITPVVGNSDDGNSSNNSASVSTPVVKPDLSLSANLPAVTPLGSSGNATFTISNIGTYAFAGSQALSGSSSNANVSVTGISSNNPSYTCTSTATTFSCSSTSGLPVSGSAAITVSYVGANVGSSGLTATLTAQNDVNTGNNSAGSSTSVERQSDLATVLSATGQCSAGSPCTFNVTVTNNGPSPSAGSYTLDVPLPSGVTANNGSGFSSNTPVITGGTARYSDASLSLASGSSRSYQFSLTPSMNSANPLGITAIGANVSDGNAGNDSSSASHAVLKPNLDFSVSALPSITALGAQTTTTMTVTNSGDAASLGAVTLSGGFDANQTLSSVAGAGWTCSVASNTRDYTCSLNAPLAPQSSLTVQLDSSAVSVGTATLTNTLSGQLAASTTSRVRTVSTRIERQSDLASVTTGPATCTVNQACAFSVTVTNNGPSASSGLYTLSMALPAQVIANAGNGFSNNTPVVSGGLVSYSDANLALPSGSSRTYSYSLTPSIDAASPLVTTVTGASAADANNSNNSSSLRVTLLKPNLTLTASVLPPVTALGTQIVSTYTISNNGDAPSIGAVNLSGGFDANQNLSSVTGTGWTCSVAGNNRDFSCSLDNPLAPQGSNTVTLTSSAVSIGTANLATSLNGTLAPGVTTRVSTDSTRVTRQSDLATAITGPASCVVNRACTYTVTVTNNGPSASAGVYNLALPIPSGATVNPGTGFSSNTPSVTGGVATYSDANLQLPSGSSIAYTVGFTPSNSTPNSVSVSVTGANAGDANTSNDSSRITPDVTVVKFDAALSTDASLSVPVQGVFVSNLNVTNTLGNAFAPNLTVSGATSDSKLEFQGVTGSGWTCSVTAASFSCDSSSAFTGNQNRPLTVTTKAVGLGSSGWNATLTSPDDNNTSNNTASRSVTVTAPTLEMVKTVQGIVQNSDGTANVTFRIDATNASPEGLSTAISDDLSTLGAGAVLVGTPSLSFPVQGSGPANTLAISSGYNGSSDKTLATGVIASGATARIAFTVKIVPQPGARNQATAISSGVTSGTGIPSSSNPTGGTGEGGATSVNLPLIGLAKAGTVTNNQNGTFDIAYVITVKNYGSEALRDTIVTDDLTGLPGVSIVSAPVVAILNAGPGGSTLAVNPGFDGSSDKALTNGRLALSASATISFTVRVAPTTAAQANFSNSAFVTATGETSGLPTSDASTPGTNPNPSGNGNPRSDTGATVTPFVETTSITITKSASPVTVTASGKLQSTIALTITNSGNTRGTVNVRDAVSSTYGPSLLDVSAFTVTNSVTGASNLSANPAFSGSSIATSVNLVASGTINGTSSATAAYTITLDPSTLTTNPISPATIDGSTTLGTVITGSSAPVSLGTGIITGTTCYDANRNGVCDAGETPLTGGVTVTITCNGGNAITTTTTSTGSYSSAVPSGTCVVTYNPGPGGITPPPVTVTVPPSTTVNPTPVTVPPTPIRAVSTINGLVFNDLNGNGAKDAGEPGMAGVTVTIDAGTPNAQVLSSNPSGAYSAVATAGSHGITITAPNGYRLIGSSKTTQTVTTVTDQDLNAAPSGVQGRSVVSGSVFNDLDGNGARDALEPSITGSSVTLTSQYGETATVTPNASGAYSTELPAGLVTITASAPSGFQATTPNPVTVSAKAGQPSSAAPIGFAQFTSLTGIVWQDSNLDGQRQTGEPGQGSVTVTVTRSGFASVKTTTDASGAYSLSVAVGSAKLEITVPTAMSVTTRNNPQDVTVTAPQGNSSGNTASPIGVMFNSGTVTGTIFDDTNANGLRDTGEIGMTGVTVSLQGVVGAPVTVTTDAGGNYSAEIKGLTAVITVTPPVNMAVSTGNNPQTVSVTPAGSSSAAAVGLSKIDVRFIVRVDRPALEVGSALKITATIVNNSPVALVASTVSFKLSPGITASPSSLPAGSSVSAPVAGIVTVTVPVVNIAAGKTLELFLNASGTPALQPSNTINATLNGSSDSKPIATPISRIASVNVTRSNAGALGNQTQLGGQVYLDANNNRSFDKGDTALAGVRVLSSLGTSAITDSSGFYTFPSLSAGRVTVRLDPSSSVSSAQIGLFDAANAVTLNLTGGTQIADFALPVGSLTIGQILETTVARGQVSITKRVTILSANQVSVELVITIAGPIKAFKLTETAKQTITGFDSSLDGALFDLGIMTISSTIQAGTYTAMYNATITDGSSPYALLDFDFYYREVAP